MTRNQVEPDKDTVILITDDLEVDFGTVPTPSISNAYATSMT